MRPDPTQARSSFDPEQMEQLKESLQERGLINPICVRRLDGSDAYEIIAGERRFRAAKALSWSEIDARIYPSTTPALETELLSLVENLQRVDLNPIEEARGYRQLAESPYSMNQEAVARQVGKKQSAISEALALLDLAPEVQQFIERSIISRGHARFLAKITNLEQQIALAKQVVAEEWSVKETERQVNALLGKKAKPNTSKSLSSLRLPDKPSSKP